LTDDRDESDGRVLLNPQHPARLSPKTARYSAGEIARTVTFRSSRRRFIAAGSAAGCAALLSPALARAAVGEGELTASAFKPLVGSNFTALALSAPGPARLVLSLLAVRPLARVAPHMPPELAQERSFELIFGAEEPGLPQDVYEIAHPGISPFAAFLVPSRDGATLLATFNRLR
jgi:hypothetical protein